MCEGKAGVGVAESRKGAALVWMEETLGTGDGGEPDRDSPFKDFRNLFEEDNDTEGGGRVVGGLAELL